MVAELFTSLQLIIVKLNRYNCYIIIKQKLFTSKWKQEMKGRQTLL